MKRLRVGDASRKHKLINGKWNKLFAGLFKILRVLSLKDSTLLIFFQKNVLKCVFCLENYLKKHETKTMDSHFRGFLEML